MNKITLIDKAMTHLVLKEPFYACIAMQQPVKRLDSQAMVELAGAPYLGCTDGSTIYINEERVEADNINKDQLVGLLQHEVEHIARLHAFRRKTSDTKIWNVACDHVINLSILGDGGKLPDEGIHDERYTNWTEEEVYADLIKRKEAGQDIGDGGDDGMDALVSPAGPVDEDTIEQVKSLVMQAAGAAKARGKMPGHVRGLIESLAPPSKDWRSEMAEFLNSVRDADYSWARLSRMWVTRGVYLPGRHSEDNVGALAFVIDTSGSVSHDELRIYFGEICAMVEVLKPSSVHILYVDAAVAAVDSFDDPSDADIRAVARRDGGGGTDMRIGLDWVDENLPDVVACLVFTDGDTPFGEEREYPVLWAISGNRNGAAPWGRTINLPAQVQRGH